jgi:hypothetical protein
MCMCMTRRSARAITRSCRMSAFRRVRQLTKLARTQSNSHATVLVLFYRRNLLLCHRLRGQLLSRVMSRLVNHPVIRRLLRLQFLQSARHRKLSRRCRRRSPPMNRREPQVCYLHDSRVRNQLLPRRKSLPKFQVVSRRLSRLQHRPVNPQQPRRQRPA